MNQDWTEFAHLVQTDRTYLAFCVDLGLFSIFQPLVLARVKSLQTIDFAPFLGLMAWLFRPDQDSATSDA
jgi:hypothetical protein